MAVERIGADRLAAILNILATQDGVRDFQKTAANPDANGLTLQQQSTPDR
jgi:hypothetical protein